MKIRFLTVAAACALAATTLAGCQTKVGTAAIVNGQKISESDLNSYLTPNAQPIQVSDTGSVSARTFVLETLVDSQLIKDALQRKDPAKLGNDGGLNNALAAARDSALQGVSNDAIDKQADASGLKRKFTDAYVTNIELKYLVSQEFANDQAGLQKAIDGLKVTVNPRYGSWDAKNFALSDLSKSQLPSFLNFDASFPGDTPPSQ